MELRKERVQMLRKKNKAFSQVTFDSDYNVPDIKPDIGRIIQNKGQITLDEVRMNEGKVYLRGKFLTELLYVGEQEGKIHSFQAKLPVEENINLEGVSSGDRICLKWEIEDIRIQMINSRKINIRAIVTFGVEADEICDVVLPISTEEKEISIKSKEQMLMDIKVHKKDTIRIREEVALSSNRPNIKEVLWYILDVRGMEIRPEQNVLKINGELSLFVIYAGEEEENPPQWVEYTLPFSENLECGQSAEAMIPHIETAMIQQNLEIKPDLDGEERIFMADVILEFDIQLYKEEKIEMLLDVYTPKKQCIPMGKEEKIDSLLIRNFSRCRINDRIELKENQGRILQLCYSQGKVKIDRVQIVENGIKVEGILQMKILYIMGDDEMPFYSMEAAVPFVHLIETRGICQEDCFYLNAELEQISATMSGNKEIEIRGSVNLNTLVLRRENIFIIDHVEEKALDMEKLQEMPGILIYIVKPGDSLWDIAKAHFTTVEEICMLNELKNEGVSAGQPLLIMKKIEKY